MPRNVRHSQPSVKEIIKNPVIEGLVELVKSQRIKYENQDRYILVHFEDQRLMASHTAHKVMFWTLGAGEHVELPISQFTNPEEILEWGTNLHLGNI